MTNQEIVAMQRRYRELVELAKTLPETLRKGVTGDVLITLGHLTDAADLIDHLNKRIDQAREAEKEAERDARDAYREGRSDGEEANNERNFF